MLVLGAEMPCGTSLVPTPKMQVRRVRRPGAGPSTPCRPPRLGIHQPDSDTPGLLGTCAPPPLDHTELSSEFWNRPASPSSYNFQTNKAVRTQYRKYAIRALSRSEGFLARQKRDMEGEGLDAVF